MATIVSEDLRGVKDLLASGQGDQAQRKLDELIQQLEPKPGRRQRVEFVLTMPRNNSWNGKWSGEDRHYAIVRTLGKKDLAKLLAGKATDSWWHDFGDGWAAQVTARVVKPGEKLKKSAGFAGYDWMVRSILACGEIRSGA